MSKPHEKKNVCCSRSRRLMCAMIKYRRLKSKSLKLFLGSTLDTIEIKIHCKCTCD